MAKQSKKVTKQLPPLERRFTFLGDGTVSGDQRVLRATQFEVLDDLTGVERTLKLWRKTGSTVDEDLRQLWLHETRQVQRVMSYAGASDVIVDIVEFVEDDENFGVLLEKAGQPLHLKLLRVGRSHWLANLGAPRSRRLVWSNFKRVVTALGIVHAQGLVHGRIGLDSIMTEGSDDPDYQLTGFEWSLWLTADKPEKSYAKLGLKSEAARAERYSFAEDWRALGKAMASVLDAVIQPSGEVRSAGKLAVPLELSGSERTLLKKLASPTRTDSLDAVSINRSIDDIIAEVGRSGASRSGTFILMFSQGAGLGDSVYTTSSGEIAVDEYRDQLDWVRGDLDTGATLLVPKPFDPTTSRMQLVTSTMRYLLGPMRQEGSSVWDVAVCTFVEPRPDALKVGDQGEHQIIQPVEVVPSVRIAVESKAKLGPDTLDWSAFASIQATAAAPDRVDIVRRGLLLVQVIEAVTKALEVFPIELLATDNSNGRRFALVRAQPNSERDRVAKRVGLVETAAALKRLFEDDHRDAEAKWRFSQASSLGANRREDIAAAFTDVEEHRGRLAYRFEIDDDLPVGTQLFLRQERDAGTEGLIARRLKIIKALGTRVDLAAMFDDPWRVRRSSRDSLDQAQREDDYFKDLDSPKRAALEGLWSTLPSYFVVGPPGVGKTRLATEIVRRRFAKDLSGRMLVTAQGHDALDHLQDKIKETLEASSLSELILVRSTASERRPTSDEDIHRTGQDLLRRLSESRLTQEAPPPVRDRIHSLAVAASRLTKAKDSADKDERVGLNAVSSLVLDSANIVISTANSPDVERLVAAREQFDWVIVEEAAKATGPELAGPLMLSGRRLLIGDHHQLPPFEADRMLKILGDYGLVAEAISLAQQYVGPLMKEGEIQELVDVATNTGELREVTEMALKLFEPFRTFVEEDARRSRSTVDHRAISSTLTEQRRMDPAIAEIVSASFYDGDLTTQAERAAAADAESLSYSCLPPLPRAPIVVVDFKHISATRSGERAEQSRPRFHNPGEVRSVIDVLRLLKRSTDGASPTLAILSFYKAQVEKLSERIDGAIKSGELRNLQEFRPAASDDKWANTVDGFQGNEADIVVLSLVRNNAGSGAGALGFLRDPRRMNVALSRAKSKLVIVGSLAFLREAVRGVNPDSAEHDLSFLTIVDQTIAALATKRRASGTPLASILSPEALRPS